ASTNNELRNRHDPYPDMGISSQSRVTRDSPPARFCLGPDDSRDHEHERLVLPGLRLRCYPLRDGGLPGAYRDLAVELGVDKCVPRIGCPFSSLPITTLSAGTCIRLSVKCRSTTIFWSSPICGVASTVVPTSRYVTDREDMPLALATTPVTNGLLPRSLT